MINKKILYGLGCGAISFTLAAASYLQEKAIGVDKKAAPSDGKTIGMEVERELLNSGESAGKKWFKAQPYREVYMTNERNEKLCGYYLPPKDGCNVIAFLIHGYKSNAFRNPMLFAEHYYEEYGYGIFVMDHTAIGKSEGHYVGFSGYESDDCLLWLKYIKENIGDFQIIIHGVSMGGATVCQMAGKDLPANVKFAIDDCGFTGGKQQIAHEFEIRNIPVHPVIEILSFVNKIKAGYTLGYTDAHKRIYDAKCPILFIHGGRDGFVPTVMGREMYSACPTEKELVIIDDATHATCVLYDPDLYWSKVDEFIEKYIEK